MGFSKSRVLLKVLIRGIESIFSVQGTPDFRKHPSRKTLEPLHADTGGKLTKTDP